MYKARALLVIVLTLCITSVSSAFDIVYVDADGPNDPGTGSYEDPFRRIQHAIDSADNGDTVVVNEGIYTGDPNNRNLHFDGKTITLRNTTPSNPDVVANTVIDPNRAGRGFYFFNSGEDSNCIISGLTIRNGYTGGKGGGVYCYNSSPTIRNCVISGNYAGTHGGGIFCQNSNLRIIGCVISGNSSANDGGGIEHWRGKSVVTNCIISNNHANGVGGGADYFDSDDVTLTNCTFVKNSANSGGAIYCWESDVVVKNAILWANDADPGPQIALNVASSSSVSISYSDVQGGEAAVYDPGNGLVWDSNNIDADPCFALFDANDDPNLWDFHLQSAYGRWDENFHRVDFNKDRTINLFDFAELANEWLKEGSNLSEDLNHNGKVDWADLQILTTYFLATGYRDRWVFDALTSLCVDTGDPNSEWAGEPWPNGKHINMGAYGGTNQASMNGNPADFNIDGVVNFVDFAEFSSQWKLEKLSADIATEVSANLVNFLDWAVFAAAWQSVPSLSNWNVRCDIFPENGDGIVDIDDLAAFVDQWLQLGVYSADIAPGEGDSIVNMLDFAVFAENWLWQAGIVTLEAQ